MRSDLGVGEPTQDPCLVQRREAGDFPALGLYSVPAWAPDSDGIDVLLQEKGFAGIYAKNPYAEWYANTHRLQGSPSHRHHRSQYGIRPYESFREEFEAASEATDMAKLAEDLKQTGAQYVVLTTKHHDGYTLWPSEQPHPRLGEFGSKRDLVGDFSSAVEEAGLRFGAYYSGGYDWPFRFGPSAGRDVGTTGLGARADRLGPVSGPPLLDLVLDRERLHWRARGCGVLARSLAGDHGERPPSSVED